jgi:hypothetical protein
MPLAGLCPRYRRRRVARRFPQHWASYPIRDQLRCDREDSDRLSKKLHLQFRPTIGQDSSYLGEYPQFADYIPPPIS